MKFALILLSTVFALNTWASDEPMTDREQEIFIKEVAKDLRRDFWNRGYDSIDSQQQKVTKSFLDNHVKSERNRRYDEPLKRDEISSLYRCFHRTDCELFYISITGSYHSGWGEMVHFVLLDPVTAEYELIIHTTYAE